MYIAGVVDRIVVIHPLGRPNKSGEVTGRKCMKYAGPFNLAVLERVACNMGFTLYMKLLYVCTYMPAHFHPFIL